MSFGSLTAADRSLDDAHSGTSMTASDQGADNEQLVTGIGTTIDYAGRPP